MPIVKRKRASPETQSKKSTAKGVRREDTSGSATGTSRKTRTAGPNERYATLLAENERLLTRIQSLEAEVARLRDETVPPDDSAPADEVLAEAVRRSGLNPGDILTHYNHGFGRIVLVPKTGSRVVIDLLGDRREEAP